MAEYILVQYNDQQLYLPLNSKGNLDQLTVYALFPHVSALKFEGDDGISKIIMFDNGVFLKPGNRWPAKVEVIMREGDAPSLVLLQVQQGLLQVQKDIQEIKSAMANMVTKQELQNAKNELLAINSYKLQFPMFGLKQMANFSTSSYKKIVNLLKENLIKENNKIKEKHEKLKKT
ncbi:hypothetical protein Mgra_00007272 [Meloidogyne graminicola]|uniref:Uncharacterized protein n=1 Tax=Meloidogyne graminicola TaxID=189291 RepID=A0A8S9ZIX9_9BILA|nr:hypothetical protein Mgra_00007272 [Meloidogyne graminicola]